MSHPQYARPRVFDSCKARRLFVEMGGRTLNVLKIRFKSGIEQVSEAEACKPVKRAVEAKARLCPSSLIALKSATEQRRLFPRELRS